MREELFTQAALYMTTEREPSGRLCARTARPKWQPPPSRRSEAKRAEMAPNVSRTYMHVMH